ncbi:MAG: ABC transporter permease [Alphaproteobacteria bacterium]|nr:ABC transporter permease [Alphaproteobacteria bacterium]
MTSFLKQASWWVLSIGLFIGLWEVTSGLGLYNAKILPPPHVFLPSFPEQAMHFDSGAKIAGQDQASSALVAVLSTCWKTITRVVLGLASGFVLGVLVGVLIRYYVYFGKLALPTLTLLAPISPFAWLPVAVYLFGVGDAPAIFLVFIAVFFIITLATIAEIDRVKLAYINVARIMGASRLQLLRHVIVPAILPGLFMILRLNLFAAWMVVLIAESAGADSGLGAVVMLARNTANNELVFLGMIVIGAIGFVFDFTLRQVQRRMLYWLPREQAALRA